MFYLPAPRSNHCEPSAPSLLFHHPKTGGRKIPSKGNNQNLHEEEKETTNHTSLPPLPPPPPPLLLSHAPPPSSSSILGGNIGLNRDTSEYPVPSPLPYALLGVLGNELTPPSDRSDSPSCSSPGPLPCGGKFGLRGDVLGESRPCGCSPEIASPRGVSLRSFFSFVVVVVADDQLEPRLCVVA